MERRWRSSTRWLSDPERPEPFSQPLQVSNLCARTGTNGANSRTWRGCWGCCWRWDDDGVDEVHAGELCPEALAGRGQVLVDEADGHSAFAHRGRHPLGRPAAHVAGG